MYDQLRPPTDNLYKFLALSGLAVAVFAVYMNVSAEIKVRVLYNQTEDAGRTADRYEDDIDRIDAALRANSIDEPRAKARKAAARKRRDTAEAKYDEALEAEKRYSRDARFQYDVLQVFGWTGGAFAVLGFWLWYVKHQRYLDEATRYEALEKRLKARELEQRLREQEPKT